MWFRHWLSNGAALCGVWLVGSGACPVTDAIALENVWNSPLVGRGAPPVPRGLSFAVVRSGGRPCCAVFVWFHTTHSRTPSPWAHRAGSAPSPEECPSARRAPLSGAPALPLHTVPPVSSCVLPVLWCLLLLWEALFLLLGSAIILCHFVLGGPCSFSPGQLRVLATHARRAGGTAPKQFLGSTPPGRAALAGRPPEGAVAQGVAPAAAPRPTAPTNPRRSPAPFRCGGDFRRRCCRWRWRCRRRSRPRRRRCCTRPRAGKLAAAAPPPAAPTQAPLRSRRPRKRQPRPGRRRTESPRRPQWRRLHQPRPRRPRRVAAAPVRDAATRRRPPARQRAPGVADSDRSQSQDGPLASGPKSSCTAVVAGRGLRGASQIGSGTGAPCSSAHRTELTFGTWRARPPGSVPTPS